MTQSARKPVDQVHAETDISDLVYHTRELCAELNKKGASTAALMTVARIIPSCTMEYASLNKIHHLEDLRHVGNEVYSRERAIYANKIWKRAKLFLSDADYKHLREAF